LISRIINTFHREELREQHDIGTEIATALSSGVDTGVDEDELEDELAELQQEELDNKMLKTGTVPVHDQVQRLPTAATGECEFNPTVIGVCIQYAMRRLTVLLQYEDGHRLWRRTTKRRSYGNCRRRWPCETRNSVGVFCIWKNAGPCLACLGLGALMKSSTKIYIRGVRGTIEWHRH